MNHPQTLVIVRHGETEWNRIAKACRTGQMPVPKRMLNLTNPMTKLSKKGISQSIFTGKGLAERYPEGFGEVYFSPWVRATQTKELLLKQFPRPVFERMEAKSRPSLFIREQDPGKLDMLMGDPEEANRIYQEYRLMAKENGHFRLKHGDVESWAEVGNRVNLFLQRLMRFSIFHEKQILIVTHGITLLMFRFLLENLTVYEVERIHDDNHPENCGVYTYTWYEPGERFVLIENNETFYDKKLRKL